MFAYQSRFFIFFLRGSPAANVILQEHGHFILLSMLGVVPAMQRRGLGGRLLTEVCPLHRRHDCRSTVMQHRNMSGLPLHRHAALGRVITAISPSRSTRISRTTIPGCFFARASRNFACIDLSFLCLLLQHMCISSVRSERRPHGCLVMSSHSLAWRWVYQPFKICHFLVLSPDRVASAHESVDGVTLNRRSQAKNRSTMRDAVYKTLHNLAFTRPYQYRH